MSDFDCIIVGGGHNGLVCAAYLARSGLRVLVAEKNPVLGGCNTTEEIPGAPGYKLNIGAIDHNAILDSPILAELQLSDYGLEYLFREALYLFPFPDGSDIPIYRSIDRTVEVLEEHSSEDAQAYRRFITFSEAVLGLFDAVSYGPPPSFAELAGLMEVEGGLDVAQLVWTFLTSPRSLLESWFTSPKVKAAIGYYAAHTQTAPSQLGAGFGPCILAASHLSGVGRPKGGSGVLNGALAASIEAHGGLVETDAEVVQITVVDRQAIGVELRDGRSVTAAHAVVTSLDARRVFFELVADEHTDPAMRARLRGAHSGGTNVSEFKVDCALSGPLDWSRFPHGSEFSAAMQLLCPSLEYLEMAFADISRGFTPEQPALMAASASMLDPTLAPPGGHTLWLSALAPFVRRDGKSWGETAEAYADRLIDVLGQYAPGVSQRIIARQITSPMDWRRRIGSQAGNPNHLDMTLDQLLGNRPIPALAGYRTPVHGLYLTGSGTHPGGGVSGIPGYNAAQVVLRELGIVPPLSRRRLVDRVGRLVNLFQTFRRLRKLL